MIINKTVLEEKMQEGDSKMYDYLIDNAENDKQVANLTILQSLSEQVPNDDVDYVALRNKSLFYMGIEI